MFLHPLAQHVGVLGGVQRQEGRTEAGAEHGLRLGDPGLGTCHLRGVAAKEPVHRLSRGQLADGRQYAVRIAGEEENVLRMAAHAGYCMVLDVLQRIAHPGVLGLALVAEINFGLAAFLEADVLQQGTETHGVPDLGFLLLG